MADRDETEMVDDNTKDQQQPEAPETEAEDTPESLEAARAELERTRAALKKANGESAERRKRLAELERAEKVRKDAELSETDRLKRDDAEKAQRLEKAEADLRQARVEHAVEMTALAMDFIDPDDAMRPEVLAAVELDEDGKVIRKSVKAALEKLAKAKPHLVGQPAGDGPDADGSPPRRTPRPRPDTIQTEQTEVVAQRSTGRYGM
jgi:hypothetical protein